MSKRTASDAFGLGCETHPKAPVDAPIDEKAVILRPPHPPSRFEQLGEALRAGKLVAFATETVYGLGANGLDEKAVLNIFEAKNRPLNDPCILHVPDAEEALKLLEINEAEIAVFKALTSTLWPGPLSVVARARAVVPRTVIAQTDFVAVRCPDHPNALELLRAARVPVAAPSANRFGHISPTAPEHVIEDLGHWHGLQVLDGGNCSVGIESTVVKLDLESKRVVILRQGGTTKDQLQAAINKAASQGLLSGITVNVEAHKPHAASSASTAAKLKEKYPPSNSPVGTPTLSPDEECPEAQEAPGMLIRHYAPCVPTFLLPSEMGKQDVGPDVKILATAARSILVDFDGMLDKSRPLFLHSFDLCRDLAAGAKPRAEDELPVEVACRNVFAILRKAEACAKKLGADAILLPSIDPISLGPLAGALHDRLTRAASGRSSTLIPRTGGAVLALKP